MGYVIRAYSILVQLYRAMNYSSEMIVVTLVTGLLYLIMIMRMDEYYSCRISGVIIHLHNILSGKLAIIDLI